MSNEQLAMVLDLYRQRLTDIRNDLFDKLKIYPDLADERQSLLGYEYIDVPSLNDLDEMIDNLDSQIHLLYSDSKN